jgi:hypothetical protein
LNAITLSPYSEQLVDIVVPSMRNHSNRVIFQPIVQLKSKALFAVNALVNVRYNRAKVCVINATDHSQTLPKHTRIGSISYQLSHICLTLPNCIDQANIRLPDCSHPQRNTLAHYQCYVYSKEFLTGNDLHIHLQTYCYPQEMREYVDNLTSHLENKQQCTKLKHVLWRHGKLFDLRAPSVIKTTLKHAIDTGDHKPVYTPPYRQSHQAEELLAKETNTLLRQGIIEPSNSPSLLSPK